MDLDTVEAIADMFDDLSNVPESQFLGDWHDGHRQGLSLAYRMCAKTLRNEIERWR